MQPPKNTWIKAFAFGTTIATSIACLVGGGYLLGSYIDARYSTDPWMKIVLMLIGLFLGATYLVFSLITLSKDKEE